ncbi:MAG: hypothetical protein LBT83_07275 [Tannerella sp.]|jgi:hypothetical protein|nr:hypothetical protein [Tannerella sp.]
MNKIALLVLYNHRYDKNIPKIEKFYQGKFSHIFHLMPFYEGERQNVIPVYESSYQFQSYIAQALKFLKLNNINGGGQYSHYFIVADDMLLNPSITEWNLFDKLGLSDDSCFITNIREQHLQKFEVFPLLYSIEKQGVEVKNILPRYNEAVRKFEYYGLETSRVKPRLLLRLIMTSIFFAIRGLFNINEMAYWTRKLAIQIIFAFGNRKLKYPLVGGWSDILIITDEVMPKFCTYCGAFAATNLFVEFAIPTALVLSSNKITLGKQLRLKGLFLKRREKEISVGRAEIKEVFDSKYNYCIKELLNDFPQDTLFIHPIKLSEWK